MAAQTDLSKLLLGDSTNTLRAPTITAGSEAALASAQETLQTVNVDDLLASLTIAPLAGEVDTSWLYPTENVAPVEADTGDRAGSDRERNKARREGIAAEDTPDLPDFLSELTGHDTWGEFAEAAGKTAITGLVSAVNPLAGIGVATAMGLVGGDDESDMTATAKGSTYTNVEDPVEAALKTQSEEGVSDSTINQIEDAVLGISGVGLLSKMVEGFAEVAGVYNMEDGITNSINDAIAASERGESPTTVAGWAASGGIDGQIERNRINQEMETAGSLDAAESSGAASAPASTPSSSNTSSSNNDKHGSDRDRDDRSTDSGNSSGSNESAGAVSGGR